MRDKPAAPAPSVNADAWDKAPNAYNDPFWLDLAEKAGIEHNLPQGLLETILFEGERSNVDQVNKATGATTPFQIIPSTARLFEKKYGVNAYESPEAAAKVAALHLRESLDRNKGDIEAAIGEYNGGPDRKTWKEQNGAYRARVLKAMQAYQAVASEPSTADQAIAPDAQAEIPSGLTDYLTKTASNFGKSIYEGVTGEQRTTPEVASAPGVYDIPELQNLDTSTAGKLMGGSMMENYLERADHISEVTGLPYRTDERGNAWFPSRDGKEYVLKPGIEPYDVAATAAASALPVGEAIGGLVKGGKMLLGGQVLPKSTGMLGSAGMPALPQVTSALGKLGSQVAGGGVSAAAEEAAAQKDFNPLDVALGTVAPLVPATVGSVARAIKKTPAAIQRLMQEPPTNGALRLVHQVPETGITNPANGSALQTAEGAAYSPEAIRASKFLGTSAPPVSVAAQNEAIRAAAATARAGGNTSAEQSAVRTYGKEVQQAAAPLVNPDFSETSVAVQNRAVADRDRQVAEAAAKVNALKTGDFAPVEDAVKGFVSKAQENAKKRADSVVARLTDIEGGTTSDAVKAGLRGDIEGLKAQEAKFWGAVDEELQAGGHNKAPISDNSVYEKAMAELQDQLVQGEKLSAVTAKPQNALLRRIVTDLQPPAISGLKNVVRPTDLQRLRSVNRWLIDLRYATDPAFSSVSRAQLKKYQAITSEAYENEVRRIGGTDLLEKLKQAKEATTARAQIQNMAEDVLSPTLEKSALPSLYSATDKLAKGDTDPFLKTLNLNTDPVVRTLVVRQAVKHALGMSAGEATPNWKKFSQWYRGVMNDPVARDAFLPEISPRDALDLQKAYRISQVAEKAGSPATQRILEGEIGKLVRNASADLGKGGYAPLSELLKSTPKGQWPALAQAVVSHAVDEGKPEAILKWYEGLLGNSNAKSLLFSQLPKETKDALEDFIAYARKQTAAAPETAAVQKSLAKGKLGAQATAAATGLAKGDPNGLRNLIAAVPEEYRESTAKMVMAAGTGASKSEGGINLTATANFADNLDRNALSKKELQKHFTKQEWDRFESVTVLARRMRQAEREVERTGRAALSKEFYQNTEGLLTRVRRQVWQFTASAMGIKGAGPLTDWWARYTQGSQKDAALRAFDKLIASHDFREMAVKYAKGLDDEARAIVRRSVRWEAFFSELKLTSPDAQTRFISNILQRASSVPSER